LEKFDANIPLEHHNISLQMLHFDIISYPRESTEIRSQVSSSVCIFEVRTSKSRSAS